MSVVYCHGTLVPVSIGLYVDNSNLQPCWCGECVENFRKTFSIVRGSCEDLSYLEAVCVHRVSFLLPQHIPQSEQWMECAMCTGAADRSLCV